MPNLKGATKAFGIGVHLFERWISVGCMSPNSERRDEYEGQISDYPFHHNGSI